MEHNFRKYDFLISNLSSEVTDKVEAILLLTLLPPTFVTDFYILDHGIHYQFKTGISRIQPQLTTFLSILREITDIHFYFEIVNNQEAILKTYGENRLEFSNKFVSQATYRSFEGGP